MIRGEVTAGARSRKVRCRWDLFVFSLSPFSSPAIVPILRGVTLTLHHHPLCLLNGVGKKIGLAGHAASMAGVPLSPFSCCRLTLVWHVYGVLSVTWWGFCRHGHQKHVSFSFFFDCLLPFHFGVWILIFIVQQLIDEQGTLKESAAEALSALGALGQPPSNTPAGGPSGLPFPVPKQQSPVHSQQALALLSLAEPGPSSHPNGPPNLGQLSALAAAAGGSSAAPVPESQTRSSDVKSTAAGEAPKGAEPPSATPTPTRTRGARSANMGSDEWARQRKDNHVRLPLPNVLHSH